MSIYFVAIAFSSTEVKLGVGINSDEYAESAKAYEQLETTTPVNVIIATTLCNLFFIFPLLNQI